MLIHEIWKWLVPPVHPVEKDHINGTLTFYELGQDIDAVRDMGRVLCIQVISEDGKIIVLIGDLLA
jgi:hypothetical protein